MHRPAPWNVMQSWRSLHIVIGCIVLLHTSRKNMTCSQQAWPTKTLYMYLWHSWALPNYLKHNESSFSLTSTISLNLRVAQMPEYGHLVIFVTMKTKTDNRHADKTDCFTPLVHACGVKISTGAPMTIISHTVPGICCRWHKNDHLRDISIHKSANWSESSKK